MVAYVILSASESDLLWLDSNLFIYGYWPAYKRYKYV